MPWVEVRGVPDWVPHERLLDAGDWQWQDGAWCGKRAAQDAADIAVRLRNQGLSGQRLDVRISPTPKPRVMRAAKTREAQRMRDRSPGFSHPRARTDGSPFVTPEDLAMQMAEGCPGTVLDAGCGCGGNSIAFARQGAQVYAIDTSRERLALARHNAKLYGVEDRIRFEHADARSVVPTTSAELVFLDPPWGDFDRIHCRELPLLDLPCPAPQLLKLPASFWTPEAVLQPYFGTAPGDRQRIKFVTWTRYRSSSSP